MNSIIALRVLICISLEAFALRNFLQFLHNLSGLPFLGRTQKSTSTSSWRKAPTCLALTSFTPSMSSIFSLPNVMLSSTMTTYPSPLHGTSRIGISISGCWRGSAHGRTDPCSIAYSTGCGGSSSGSCPRICAMPKPVPPLPGCTGAWLPFLQLAHRADYRPAAEVLCTCPSSYHGLLQARRCACAASRSLCAGKSL